MADPTAAFFDALDRRGHEPRLEKASGTLRFDLEQNGRTERWFVAVRRGDVNASRTPEPRAADCVLRTTQDWFDRFVTGEENALPALLRGDAIAEGNLQLMFHFQRLMPNPPGARDPRDLNRPAEENGRDV
jgi:hypothetical protein